MIGTLHLAAQYLAAANISFLDKKDDDSHTNLGWSKTKQRLCSRIFSENGDQLCLNFDSISLIWLNSSNEFSLTLPSSTHTEVLNWLNNLSKENLEKDYTYDFHYKLPYALPTDNFQFQNFDKEGISTFSNYLNTTQEAFEETLKTFQLSSEIRVWPHHFDLGAFVTPNETISIGFGLAIPDELITDFYIYVSGYKGHDSVETKHFAPLSIGEWKTGSWKAASLKVEGKNKDQIMSFLKETLEAYIDMK